MSFLILPCPTVIRAVNAQRQKQVTLKFPGQKIWPKPQPRALKASERMLLCHTPKNKTRKGLEGTWFVKQTLDIFYKKNPTAITELVQI